MRESGRSLLGRALGWWPVAVDLGLALVVFALTADQGTGTQDFELFGEAPAATRVPLAVGMAMLVLVRRVNPYPLFVLGLGAWALMGAPWGLMVAGYTIAARPRRPPWFWPLVAGLALAVLTRTLVVSETSARFAVVVMVLVVGVPVLLGLWVGIRRALVEHLRGEAERLEREQLLEAERAKAQERARIAREMHDVVAHRVGLMVLHAGALEVSLADPRAAEQAALVRQTGREALDELRQVLGVLREHEDGVPLDPQPTLAGLDRLAQQSRDAGMEVTVAVEGERRRLPATVAGAADQRPQARRERDHRGGDLLRAGAARGHRQQRQAGQRGPPGPGPGRRRARAGGPARAGHAARRHPRGRPQGRRRLRGVRIHPGRGAGVTPEEPRRTRVVLVDDEQLVRSGLRMILESAGDIEVVGEAGDGGGAVDQVRLHRPEVVLMDIRMPAMDGLAATRELTALPDPPRIIILTTFELDEYVHTALENGAVGFLLKDTPPRDLIQAVHTVAEGNAMLAPSVTRRLIAEFAARNSTQAVAARTQLEALTDREREVAVAIAQGLSNAEIAKLLFMSEATVKAHVSHVLAKLNLTNRVQAAMLVHDGGLTGT